MLCRRNISRVECIQRSSEGSSSSGIQLVQVLNGHFVGVFFRCCSHFQGDIGTISTFGQVGIDLINFCLLVIVVIISECEINCVRVFFPIHPYKFSITAVYSDVEGCCLSKGRRWLLEFTGVTSSFQILNLVIDDLFN